MGLYQESIHNIETPLSDYNDPYYDPLEDDEFYGWTDPVQSVQQRMMLILAVVFVLAALAFVTIWRSDNGRTRQTSAPAETTSTTMETNAAGAAAAAAVGNGISPLFTPEVQHWAPQITRWAAEHDLDPDIVATIMQIESCGDPQAVSSAGAQGLFQVMPFHFTNGETMQDPDTNARRGMLFYNEMLRYTGGDVLLSFAGYNGGYAAAGSAYANWPNETQRYHKWAKGIYEDAKAGRTESQTLNEWLAAGGGAGCQRAATRLGIN